MATADLTVDAVAVANSFDSGRSSASFRRSASYSPSVTSILVVGCRHSAPCSYAVSKCVMVRSNSSASAFMLSIVVADFSADWFEEDSDMDSIDKIMFDQRGQ